MMQKEKMRETGLRRWTKFETAFVIWAALALIALPLVAAFLKTSFPIFTVLWIGVPLIVVLVRKDAQRVGFRPIPWRKFFIVAAINLGVLLLIMAIVEPWSHTYRLLVEQAVTASDSTFAWLSQGWGITAWIGVLLYSGLVTLFGEELFFRGWLLQAFKPRLGRWGAIVLQAALFTLPNLIAALLMPALQGILYALVYAFLAIGIVGGWAAERTGSIWPSLTAATITNLVLTALLLPPP
jgi:membrane protease YdiL (CAAX protease family)